jgi:hypothetical protein
MPVNPSYSKLHPVGVHGREAIPLYALPSSSKLSHLRTLA